MEIPAYPPSSRGRCDEVIRPDRRNSRRRRSRVAAFVGCLGSCVVAVALIRPTASADQLSPASLRGRLLADLDAQGPGVALSRFKAVQATHPEVADYCHPIVHDLGRAALAHYQGDFAKAAGYADDVCGGGYLHGVVEAKFADSGDPAADVFRLCAPREEGSCLHGVGHGAMFVTGGQVPKALALCDELPAGIPRIRCAEGVFMQNFETDLSMSMPMSLPQPYQRAADPGYPCAEQRGDYRSVCWFYAPSFYLSLHHDDWAAALSWCAKRSGDDEYSCTEGVGSRAMKANITAPGQVGHQCAQGTPTQLAPCLAGMVSYYRVNYGNNADTTGLCQAQPTALLRDACTAASGPRRPTQPTQ